jgi:hypothetical protein
MTIIYRAGIAMLVALLYFVLAAIDDSPLLLVSAVGLGIASVFLQKVFADLRREASVAACVVVPAFGTLSAAAIAVPLGAASGWSIWGGVVAAAVAGWIGLQWARGDVSAQCALCKRRVKTETDLRGCPRCGRHVCPRPSCWAGQYVRCTHCHDRGVVALPVQDGWWATHLGPRLKDGQCVVCLSSFEEADLRECHQCHWPTCRRCWDYHNGRCTRCGWTIPALPAALAAVVGPSPRPARNPRRP